MERIRQEHASRSQNAPIRDPRLAGVLALQRAAGNRAVLSLMPVQRVIDVGGADLVDVLAKNPALVAHAQKRVAWARRHSRRAAEGVTPVDHAWWFREHIQPGVHRLTWDTFNGYLHSPNTTITVGAVTGSTPLPRAVVQAINVHRTRLSGTPGRYLGVLSVSKRHPWDSHVEDRFDRDHAARVLGLKRRQVHLRHVVMSSWFRALPAVLGRVRFIDPADQGIAAVAINTLTARLRLLSGERAPDLGAELAAAALGLARALDLCEFTLNLGHGPQNTVIGYASRSCTELALRVAAKKERFDSIGDLAGAVTAKIRATAHHAGQGAVEAHLAEHDPLELLTGMLPAVDPLPRAVVVEALHELAFTLGTDLMAQDEGKPARTGGADRFVPRVQGVLVPVGESIYSMARTAQDGEVPESALTELVARLTAMVAVFEAIAAETKPRRRIAKRTARESKPFQGRPTIERGAPVVFGKPAEREKEIEREKEVERESPVERRAPVATESRLTDSPVGERRPKRKAAKLSDHPDDVAGRWLERTKRSRTAAPGTDTTADDGGSALLIKRGEPDEEPEKSDESTP
ncbi:hypothetical protein SAMN04487818_1139 [Actinokineospora terrae]|uniref:Uncharacterized protein n=1 Tax=Actinokineospora terrae TaxID=155974 RepID=A0A1H9X5S2_9PSEU|nr:hypothetical protein SAMN04487818_1139 [Actinokineospora terrae]